MRGTGFMVALALAAGALTVRAADPPPWAFRVGDDPAWADPALDEAGWERGDAPAPLAMPRHPYCGWYRFHFTVGGPRPAGGWGIRIGRVQTADEVFLNGVRIGGEGRIGDRFVDALYKERVYALPDRLLRPGDNVLALRVQSSFDRGGLAGGPVEIGDAAALVTEARARAARRRQTEAFFLGAIAAVFAMRLLLALYRVRQPEYAQFGAMVALLGSVVLLESLLWYDAGFATPWSQRVVVVLFLWTPVPLLLFAAGAGGGPWLGRAHRGLAAACGGLGLAYLAWGSLRWVRAAETAWWILLAGAAVLLARQAWRLRVWRQSAEPLAVAVGIAVFGLLAAIDLILPTRMAAAIPFGLPMHAGFAAMGIALACALAIRARRMNERLRSLSRQVLAAHEDACARTASALHDDVAPTLAAVKLDLQMLLRNRQLQEEGRRMVGAVSAAIERTRTLSREMHPVAVDRLGLAAALRTLADRLAEANGWTLRLDLAENAVPPGPRTVMVYRMGQELLYNVAKHAAARTVEVSLATDARGLRLVVRDDGRGCDPAATPPGMGWIGLRERAAAAEGRCRIERRRSGGLEVDLWIPHR